MIVNSYGTHAQLYDIETNTWTYVSSTTAYSGPWTSMAPAGGLLWMIRDDHIFSYDTETDAWDTVTTYVGVDDANMTESDQYGVIYGHSATGQMIIYDTVSGDLDYFTTGYGDEYETRLGYDPGTRSIFFGAFMNSYLYQWYIDSGVVVERTPIPESRLNNIFCSDRSGHIYAAGSDGGTTILQYDIATDSWAEIPNLPSDHGNTGSCTVSGDGYLYVSSGTYQRWYRLPLY